MKVTWQLIKDKHFVKENIKVEKLKAPKKQYERKFK